MAGVKRMFLLINFQGFYLGSICQDWRFPHKITSLIGSCVEIPCTYHPASTSGTSSTVWYLYSRISYPEILNTRDSSSVNKEYRDRTSLVPGENSCTLRIDPVRERDGDEYYPGISEDKKTNAYDKRSRTVHLGVTDIPGKFDLHVPQILTEGEATIINCTAEHTCGSSPPSLQWNKPGQIQNKSVDISGGTWREESMLTYIPSYLDDGTPVQCTATYPNGQKTERPEILNIKYAPKNVTVTITGNSELVEGSDVTLQCNSFSNPHVYDYEWYKGKTKLPDRGQEITVMDVTWDMESYFCAAINNLGRGTSAPTEIPVKYAATGVHITVKKEHEFSELICDLLSSRPDVTHYTWMKDGSILHNETEKTLTIHSNEEDYGQYSCIAHNSAGNSSSEEICIKREKFDLPLILGTVAGCLFLILLIVVIYFSVRQIRKSFPAFRKQTPAANNTTAIDETLIEENQYGNIQSDRNAQPDSMRSISLIDMNFKDNYVIYSNSEVMQPKNEVEYSDICHVQHDHMTSSRVDHGHNVEYATLRL